MLSDLSSRLRLPGLLASLALALALAAPSAASAQIDPLRLSSSPVGVADGQVARIHAYFVAALEDERGLPPGPCRIILAFLDEAGATVAESDVTLGPGRDTLLDYTPAGLRPGERKTVRAELRAARDAAGLAPRLMPSLEVFDKASGRTAIADPGGVRDQPASDATSSFGTFSLASQQVARISAAYVGLPSPSGLPPGPCNVTITLFSGNGSVMVSRVFRVAPGETAALDYPTGTMPDGVRRRMWATAAADRDAQGFVTASTEVFDEPTGRSTVLYPADLVLSWGWE